MNTTRKLANWTAKINRLKATGHREHMQDIMTSADPWRLRKQGHERFVSALGLDVKRKEEWTYLPAECTNRDDLLIKIAHR
jgi:hypothetical protein